MNSMNSKSFSFGHYVPNDEKVLNKRIPGNPKYQHVKPAVNTGSTVKRQIDELKEKHKNCQQKKDEVFYRIKFLNFLELILEGGKVKLKLEKAHDDNNSEKESEKSCDNNKVRHPDKILSNVLIGIGEIDLANQKKNPLSTVHKMEKILPYLLLDVRDKEQFVKNHIKTAMHYPSALLARSIGFETEEMKLYKNSPPEIIILYDDDESISVRVATTLVQRGYDNIFVLTGGLNHCSKVFPKRPLSHLLTNELPDPSISGSPTVIVKNAISELSQEDITVIEQYTDCRENGRHPQNTRSGSSLSRSGKQGLNKVDEASAAKAANLTYRRGSNSSLKSIDPTQLQQSKSVMDNRSKSGRKAPWK